MARQYLGKRIVSKFRTLVFQHAFIAGHAQAEGLRNLAVITADMNGFHASHRFNARFDRVGVLVEMFCCMYGPLAAAVGAPADRLAPDGFMFMHVFAKSAPRIGSVTGIATTGSRSLTGKGGIAICRSQASIRQLPDRLAWLTPNAERVATTSGSPAQHWLAKFRSPNADAVPLCSSASTAAMRNSSSVGSCSSWRR